MLTLIYNDNVPSENPYAVMHCCSMNFSCIMFALNKE